MWDWFLQLISHPATEAGIHLMVLAIFFMEVWQHWQHHKKNKERRGEKLYTLDEARIVLFNEVADANRLYNGPMHGMRSDDNYVVG
ncbi:MAG: hypothetical protein HMLIMOIP_002703 [Candidatus Nitrosomirales archaeon]|jgi:hypothetical protein